MTTYTVVQVTAIVLTGLAAGLFYSYDCSVINGLGNLPDREYLMAFQSINRAILNPYFFMSFMGSLLLLPVAAWISYKGGHYASFYFMLSAAIIYVVGVFGITMAGNVPLNDMLDRFDIGHATPGALEAFRQKFETKWNPLHHIRTYAAILAFVASIISIIKKS
jgi:uncharacterized membrane protein